MTISPSLEIEATARLCAALDRNSLALETAEQRRRAMSAAVYSLPLPGIDFLGSEAPYSPGASRWGPKTGWNWAVQSVTVTNLGSSDIVKLYRGNSKDSTVPNNVKQQFAGATGVDTVVWHPGRTGLVLHGGESLAFSGTLTSATRYYVNFEGISVTDEQLPYFLL